MAGAGSADEKMRQAMEREEDRRRHHQIPSQRHRTKSHEQNSMLQSLRRQQIERYEELKPLEEEPGAKVAKLKGELSSLYAEMHQLKRQNAAANAAKPHVPLTVTRAPLPTWLWSLVNMYMNGQPLPEPPGTKKPRASAKSGGEATTAAAKRKREAAESAASAPAPTADTGIKKAKVEHAEAHPTSGTAHTEATPAKPDDAMEAEADENEMRHLEEDLEAEMEKEFDESDEQVQEQENPAEDSHEHAPKGSAAEPSHEQETTLPPMPEKEEERAASAPASPPAAHAGQDHPHADAVSDSEDGSSELVMHDGNSDNSDSE